MLSIEYFIIVSGHNVKELSCKISIFDLWRVQNCLRTHQMPSHHLQTAILKHWGGPWLGLDGPGGHYMGPHGCSSTCIVTK